MAKRKELTCLESQCVLINSKGEEVGIIPFSEYCANIDMVIKDNLIYYQRKFPGAIITITPK